MKPLTENLRYFRMNSGCHPKEKDQAFDLNAMQ